MDFSLSEEQTAIQDLAKQIFRGAVSDESLRGVAKSEAPFDAGLWKQLAEVQTAAMKKRKALEILKSKDQGKYLARMNQLEQNANDEMTMVRHQRREEG